MKINTSILSFIKKDKTTRARLALALDKSDHTIQRYLEINSEQLTLAAALKVIREEYGKATGRKVEDSELLELVEKVA